MANKKLISFVVRSQMGLFKKTDINDVYLTYNMLHKPALLGILGAIVGLSGFVHKGKSDAEAESQLSASEPKTVKDKKRKSKKEEEKIPFPEYYLQLGHIPVGIEPLHHEKGVFQKAMISYTNTTGFANQGENKDGATLLITEQTLIDPAYRIFLLLDISNENEKKLYQNIKNQHAVFLPYMGKNDYSLWWDKDEVEEHEFQENFSDSNSKEVITVFVKTVSLFKSIDDDENTYSDIFDVKAEDLITRFSCFERLPTHYDEALRQYAFGSFAYSNFKIRTDAVIQNLYFLPKFKKYIQLN